MLSLVAPAGKHGAFLGPQDQYFAILPAASATLRVYLTASFRGKSAPAYTLDLGRPAPGAGPALLPGPPALGAPRESAEAEAAAKEKAAREKERKEREAAEKGEAAAGGDGGDAAPGVPEAVAKAERRAAEASSEEEVRWGRGAALTALCCPTFPCFCCGAVNTLGQAVVLSATQIHIDSSRLTP